MIERKAYSKSCAQCSKQFLAASPKAKCCSKACRDKKYRSSSPLYNEKRRSAAALWRRNNLDKERARHARYKAAHPEKVKACVAEWAARNQDRIKIGAQKWQDANRERANATSAQWRAKNPEKVKAIAAKSRKLNYEKDRAAAKSRRDKNRGAINAKAAKYRAENPDVGRKSVAKWRAKNPDKVRDMWGARRARKAGASGSHTENEVSALYKKQKGRCANMRCRIDLSGGFHRDHIMPLARGGDDTIRNIQILCPACNLRKKDKDPIAWANQQGMLV
jgi:5-methylcytosine-specific restriction endonuclease McrA